MSRRDRGFTESARLRQGDNDPVDVVEIGSATLDMGGIYEARCLGRLAGCQSYVSFPTDGWDNVCLGSGCERFMCTVRVLETRLRAFVRLGLTVTSAGRFIPL
jgi:hypothetical protein